MWRREWDVEIEASHPPSMFLQNKSYKKCPPYPRPADCVIHGWESQTQHAQGVYQLAGHRDMHPQFVFPPASRLSRFMSTPGNRTKCTGFLVLMIPDVDARPSSCGLSEFPFTQKTLLESVNCRCRNFVQIFLKDAH